MFVTFIFVTETGPGLDWAGLNIFYGGLKHILWRCIFYGGAETSRIASICDVFVKSSRELICDMQYMTLSKNVTDVFL
jgi:hypothetical protein